MGEVWAAFRAGLAEVEPPAQADVEGGLGGNVEPLPRADVEAWVQASATAWPEFELPASEIAEALGRIVADTGALPDADTGRELTLALCCARGDAEAIATFEALYFRDVDVALRGIADKGVDLDDIKQRLRTRLFVAPDGGRARIVDAVGHGDLGALVRIAATRLALNDVRGDRRREARSKKFTDDVAVLQPAADTPELEVVRRTHQARFKAAFEAAVARLTPRDRTLLRYHLVDHLTIDDLARMHGVHRSSAARWLANARRLVAEYTQEHLSDVVDDQSALPALLALVRSRLDLSITRVFVD